MPTRVPSRSFIVIGQKARASADFSLADLPSSSGRLDVPLRCVRAALLVSHGLRRDTTVYLVLLGGPLAPRTLRVAGHAARYVRPDERSLATLVRKSLDRPYRGREFVEVRPGVALADAGLDVALDELRGARLFVLDSDGRDVRAERFEDDADLAFVVGDPAGFDEASRSELAARGAGALRVGPVCVHAEDAVTIVVNELDRRAEAEARR